MFKLVLCSFLSAIIAVSMGIKEGDVEGALGNGREFTRSSGKSLGYAYNATNEILSSQCCEECLKKYPDTEMFAFKQTGNAGAPENVCYCRKRNSPEERLATQAFEVVSGICPNYAGGAVRGAVGQGRGIQFAEYHGFNRKWNAAESKIESIVDKNECCDVCNDSDRSWLPDEKITGSLYTFIEQMGGCECYTTEKFGFTPKTFVQTRASGICN